MELNLRGQNARLAILGMLEAVQDHLLANREDDTKALNTIISIYESTLLFSGVAKSEVDQRWKSFQMAKRMLDNKLIGNRRTIRPLLVERVLLQHESRLMERNHVQFTDVHEKVLRNLFKLATSQYSSVRTKAQDSIVNISCNHAYSYKLLIDPVINLLSPDNSLDEVSHEAFKGALYVMLGFKNKTMLVKHDWETMFRTWPALVTSRHSEKPSISKLLDIALSTLQVSYPC